MAERTSRIAWALVLFGGLGTLAATELIPQPLLCVAGPGELRMTREATLYVHPAFAAEASVLAAGLRADTGWPLPMIEAPARATIRMIRGPTSGPGEEAYDLWVRPESVDFRANSPAGAARAVATLRQLLPVGGARDTISLPDLVITDTPRFAWRGLMLDCSRTFQSVDFLKQTIDRMAFYKLNILHLHLTDDQGWRLALRRYPELTERGARFPDRYHEPPAHQGFYTQDQMRDLVAYAAARHVTIVPEIEMPGHCLAALACHPDLSCRGGRFEIYPFGKGPNITEDVFCAGNDEVFVFLESVLDEVAALFPGPFLHVGGDEVPKTRWKACPKCQARMAREGLKDEHELQSYFMRRISALVEKRGKRMLGWDEILEGGLAPNATVMSWRGTKGGLAAAQAGHDVVMSPTSHCYFDYSYEQIDSMRAFSFDPLAGIPEEAWGHVLGLQANFWSHIDREPERVEAQLFPRLLALAERGWSPRNMAASEEFAKRLQAHLPRLRAMGIHYHDEAPNKH